MKIPLIKRLKKESHRKLALAQDLIVEEIVEIIPRAVFHGGTCIWRCYEGKRFSEDLDFYFPNNKKLVEQLFKSLKNKGLEIKKKKITERSLYSELIYERTSIRLEATFQNKKSQIIDYEKANGIIISIHGLTIEQLINEKINTYFKRKKIRDIYDIFFLLRKTNNFKLIDKKIKKIFEDKAVPEDTQNLKTLILEGVVPTLNELRQYIKRKWENPNI